MRRSARPLFAVLLAALAPACATAASAHKAELRRTLDKARVSRTPAEIWPEVQRFLDQRGYPLVGNDRLAVGKPAQGSIPRVFSFGFQTRLLSDGSRILETDPMRDTRTRVRVEASPAEGGGSRLRVRLIKPAGMSTTDTVESRDEDLQLALLERLDPAAAARVTGRPPPAPLPAASSNRWARVRPLLGTWTGQLADGTTTRWRFAVAADQQFVEMHGTPLLFAGPAAHAVGEEMGRISRTVAGDRLVWTQFTNAGRVDRYETSASPTAEATLVFVAQTPESLPAGARARLALRRSGDQLEVALDIAEPDKDFAPAGTLRLTRGLDERPH
jgi:hypothetical protein